MPISCGSVGGRNMPQIAVIFDKNACQVFYLRKRIETFHFDPSL